MRNEILLQILKEKLIVAQKKYESLEKCIEVVERELSSDCNSKKPARLFKKFKGKKTTTEFVYNFLEEMKRPCVFGEIVEAFKENDHTNNSKNFKPCLSRVLWRNHNLFVRTEKGWQLK